ncbi:hypothetical protein VKT23_013039 [Stygiomarasmius scandens]|uniref:Uncharacterized protein n=1 Tax=Marasmiellus scandens TaxID=2682957 RepID=A0ABR1J6Z2_9AGAR
MPGKRGCPRKYHTDKERKEARRKVAHNYHIRRGKSLRQLRRELKKVIEAAEKKKANESDKDRLPPSSPLPTSPLPLPSTPFPSSPSQTTIPPLPANDYNQILESQQPQKPDKSHLAALSGYRWPRARFVNVSSDSESELPYIAKKQVHVREVTPEDNTLPMASSVENSPK